MGPYNTRIGTCGFAEAQDWTFRLHGRPAYHCRYRYTGVDLRQLQGVLSRAWPNRVPFNNDAMVEDARRLIRCLGG